MALYAAPFIHHPNTTVRPMAAPASGQRQPLHGEPFGAVSIKIIRIIPIAIITAHNGIKLRRFGRYWLGMLSLSDSI